MKTLGSAIPYARLATPLAVLALLSFGFNGSLNAQEAASAEKDFAELVDSLRGSWQVKNSAVLDLPERGISKGQQLDSYATIEASQSGTILQWNTVVGSEVTRGLISVDRGGNQIRSFHTAPDGGHWEMVIAKDKKSKGRWNWKLTKASFPTGDMVSGKGTWTFTPNGKVMEGAGKLKVKGADDIELSSRMVRLSKSTDAKGLAAGSVRRFLRNFNSRNVTGLANEFVKDSARVISLYQLPLEGRDAIAASFDERFADGGDSEGAMLDAVVKDARYLSGDVILADGTWEIVDTTGVVLRHGKWGNVLQIEEGQWKLLLESAHAEITHDEVGADKSASRLPVPDALTAQDDPVVPLIERSIARYANGMRTSDFDGLAREFTIDGVQLVGNVAGASRGYQEIKEGFSSGVGDGSPYEKTVLDAKVLGIRKISDTLVAAYGVWDVHSSDGELIDFGQWGNVLRVSDGEAKMIMESAGSFE